MALPITKMKDRESTHLLCEGISCGLGSCQDGGRALCRRRDSRADWLGGRLRHEAIQRFLCCAHLLHGILAHVLHHHKTGSLPGRPQVSSTQHSSIAGGRSCNLKTSGEVGWI
jgi:hypothetical protein